MGSGISQRGYMSIEGSGRARREGSRGLRFMEEVRRKRRREVSANRPKGTDRAGEMRKSSSLSRAQIGALAMDPAVTIVVNVNGYNYIFIYPFRVNINNI